MWPGAALGNHISSSKNSATSRRRQIVTSNVVHGYHSPVCPALSSSLPDVLNLRLLYPVKLVLEPADRIHSGMGGVIFLSVSAATGVVGSDSSRRSGELASVLRKESKLPWWLRGLGTAGRLPLRMRVRVRMLCLSEMT